MRPAVFFGFSRNGTLAENPSSPAAILRDDEVRRAAGEKAETEATASRAIRARNIIVSNVAKLD